MRFAIRNVFFSMLLVMLQVCILQTEGDQIERNDETDHEETKFIKDNKLIDRIVSLRKRLRQVSHEQVHARRQKANAIEALHDSLQRRNSLAQQTHEISENRHNIEKSLYNTHESLQKMQSTVMTLSRKEAHAKSQILRLKHHTEDLHKRHRQHLRDFEHHGLSHWIRNWLYGNIPNVQNAYVRTALVRGTRHLVDGIDTIVDANESLPRKLSHLDGTAVVIILTMPFMIALMLLLKMKKQTRTLTSLHCTMLTTLYFTLFSCASFITTSLLSDSLTITIQNSYLLVLLHTFLYAVLITGHITKVRHHNCRKSMYHAFITAVIGCHFALHSYHRSVRGDCLTYIVYTYLFGCVLADLLTPAQKAHGAIKLAKFNKAIKCIKVSSKPLVVDTGCVHINPQEGNTLEEFNVHFPVHSTKAARCDDVINIEALEAIIQSVETTQGMKP